MGVVEKVRVIMMARLTGDIFVRIAAEKTSRCQ